MKGVRLLYPLQVSRWPLHRARAHPQCRWVLSPGSVASCRLQVRIEAPPFFLVRPFRRRFENRSATRRRACARSVARGSSAGARGLVAWRLELLGHTGGPMHQSGWRPVVAPLPEPHIASLRFVKTQNSQRERQLGPAPTPELFWAILALVRSKLDGKHNASTDPVGPGPGRQLAAAAGILFIFTPQ